MKNTIKISDHGNTKIVAHRGLSGLERENTCSAFVAAANRSYFGIETDVRRTLDGYYVLQHDGTTERNCVDSLEPEKSTFHTLRSLRYKDRDGSFDRGDLMMPTLAEYVKICRDYGKVGVLELKGLFTEEMAAGVVDVIRSLDYLEGIIFIAFNWDSLINLRHVYPEAVCQYLTHRIDPMTLIPQLVENHFGIDANFNDLTAENVRALKENGIVVNCWTVDTAEDAERLIGYGVDQITSNILE